MNLHFSILPYAYLPPFLPPLPSQRKTIKWPFQHGMNRNIVEHIEALETVGMLNRLTHF